MSFLHLPNVILDLIFSELSLQDIASISMTCRTLSKSACHYKISIVIKSGEEAINTGFCAMCSSGDIRTGSLLLSLIYSQFALEIPQRIPQQQEYSLPHIPDNAMPPSMALSSPGPLHFPSMCFTGLISAASHGHIRLASYLLGISPFFEPHLRQPITVLITTHHPDGSIKTRQSHRNLTPVSEALSAAAGAGHTDMVQMLADWLCERREYTPSQLQGCECAYRTEVDIALCYAAREGHLSTCKVLLEHHLRTKFLEGSPLSTFPGQALALSSTCNALQMAAGGGHDSVCSLLLTERTHFSPVDKVILKICLWCIRSVIPHQGLQRRASACAQRTLFVYMPSSPVVLLASLHAAAANGHISTFEMLLKCPHNAFELRQKCKYLVKEMMVQRFPAVFLMVLKHAGGGSNHATDAAKAKVLAQAAAQLDLQTLKTLLSTNWMSTRWLLSAIDVAITHLGNKSSAVMGRDNAVVDQQWGSSNPAHAQNTLQQGHLSSDENYSMSGRFNECGCAIEHRCDDDILPASLSDLSSYKERGDALELLMRRRAGCVRNAAVLGTLTTSWRCFQTAWLLSFFYISSLCRLLSFFYISSLCRLLRCVYRICMTSTTLQRVDDEVVPYHQMDDSSHEVLQ